MSNTTSAASTIESPLRRRPWTTPQLVVHESMMVLTQHFFGAPTLPLLLQADSAGISCGVGQGGAC